MLIVQRANVHHFPQVGGSAQLRIRRNSLLSVVYDGFLALHGTKKL
jgi:hypothetical protein